MTAAAIPYPTLVTAQAPGTDRGVSKDAGFGRFRLIELGDLTDAQSLTRGNFRRQMIGALRDALAGADVDNWDGAGARRFNVAAASFATDFIRMLPWNLSVLPEISVDKDGEVYFEWAQDARRVFSLSVGQDGRLSFALLFGWDSTYGSLQLGDAIPASILNGITRVSPYATQR